MKTLWRNLLFLILAGCSYVSNIDGQVRRELSLGTGSTIEVVNRYGKVAVTAVAAGESGKAATPVLTAVVKNAIAEDEIIKKASPTHSAHFISAIRYHRLTSPTPLPLRCLNCGERCEPLMEFHRRHPPREAYSYSLLPDYQLGRRNAFTRVRPSVSVLIQHLVYARRRT